MADRDSIFTKEDLELLLNFGTRLILGQINKATCEVKETIDPNVSFANTLKAKYDALVTAGFSEKQAFELALKAVEEILKQATGRVDGQNKEHNLG